MEDVRKDTKLLLQAIDLINNECPNNDEGGICSGKDDCLDCWQQYLRNNNSVK